MKNATTLTACIACGNNKLFPCLDLGHQPPANNLREHITDVEPAFPLNVERCAHCNHLQLDTIVNPDILYKNYLYVSGTSQTYRDYMDWYAAWVLEQFNGNYDNHVPQVLDIGCNDGSQLDAFAKLGCWTHGVDPAENLLPISSAKDHTVVCDYWGDNCPAALSSHYDIITSQNAFSHIPDPLSYLKTVRKCLEPNGKMFISTSQADMVLNGEFDTIYHEHISFYNAYSMKCLAERAGLYLVDVVKTPIHGVSYIFVLSKVEYNQQRIANILAMEQAQGLQNPDTYYKWAARAEEIMQEAAGLVEGYRTHHGYKVIGYGAAAKGMTFLTASGIECDVIIDDNPLKQGRYMPGMNTLITNSDYLLQQLGPDDQVLFIPLAWNFFDEIQSKILSKRKNAGDRFLRYFPKVDIE